jgi:hypothetical protein
VLDCQIVVTQFDRSGVPAFVRATNKKAALDGAAFES